MCESDGVTDKDCATYWQKKGSKYYMTSTRAPRHPGVQVSGSRFCTTSTYSWVSGNFMSKTSCISYISVRICVQRACVCARIRKLRTCVCVRQKSFSARMDWLEMCTCVQTSRFVQAYACNTSTTREREECKRKKSWFVGEEKRAEKVEVCSEKDRRAKECVNDSYRVNRAFLTKKLQLVIHHDKFIATFGPCVVLPHASHVQNRTHMPRHQRAFAIFSVLHQAWLRCKIHNQFSEGRHTDTCAAQEQGQSWGA